MKAHVYMPLDLAAVHSGLAKYLLKVTFFSIQSLRSLAGSWMVLCFHKDYHEGTRAVRDCTEQGPKQKGQWRSEIFLLQLL